MAKFYYAKWHVRIGDLLLFPGEVFELPDGCEADAQRLLSLDAIAEAGEPEGASDSGDRMPEQEAEPEETEAEPEETEEVYAEPAPMEIDAMDGIAAAPKAPAKKGKKTGGKKA